MIQLLIAVLLSATTLPALADDALPTGALPDAVIANGHGVVEQAWLAEPTERYGHAILGDAIEAGALMVKLDGGRVLGLRLPRSSVFEDRHVRLADFNGDGVDEMVVVESSLSEGAALAVYGIREGRLQLIGRDSWIGTRNRWLNPAGIADFDGDGRLEVAIVVTPHIGGTLRFLRPDGMNIVNVAEMWGFSNHAIGSRDQHLSAVVDWDGDGVMDLALPDDSRRTVRVLSLASGKLKELDVFPLSSGVAGDFELVDGPAIRVPLHDGSVAALRPSGQ